MENLINRKFYNMLITDTIQQQNGTKIIDADHIVSLKEHMQVYNSKYFLNFRSKTKP